jgi:hypothetical protein
MSVTVAFAPTAAGSYGPTTLPVAKNLEQGALGPPSPWQRTGAPSHLRPSALAGEPHCPALPTWTTAQGDDVQPGEVLNPGLVIDKILEIPPPGTGGPDEPCPLS